jgi:hypothetical protein
MEKLEKNLAQHKEFLVKSNVRIRDLGTLNSSLQNKQKELEATIASLQSEKVGSEKPTESSEALNTANATIVSPFPLYAILSLTNLARLR